MWHVSIYSPTARTHAARTRRHTSKLFDCVGTSVAVAVAAENTDLLVLKPKWIVDFVRIDYECNTTIQYVLHFIRFVAEIVCTSSVNVVLELIAMLKPIIRRLWKWFCSRCRRWRWREWHSSRTTTVRWISSHFYGKYGKSIKINNEIMRTNRQKVKECGLHHATVFLSLLAHRRKTYPKQYHGND